MSMRTATGQLLRWEDTRAEVGFSNFLFVDRYYRSNVVLRRILSLARLHGYQSIAVEAISEANCEIIQDENDALRIRANFTRSTVHRLTLWKCPPYSPPGPDDFIGYAVVKTDEINGQQRDHVFESVLPPVRQRKENNFLHSLRKYEVETPAGIQTVTGALYAQQNDLTFVCAHVALRTALASMLPDGDITYKKMNDIIGVDHSAHKVGGGAGLSPEELEKVLASVGVASKKVVHEPSLDLNLPNEFQRDIYGFIESGGPALLGFELNEPGSDSGEASRHIVPILGHTFNDDAWVPDAQRAYFGEDLGYFSSESWLSSYVLHDDNFGPYYCLPRHFLKKDSFRLILGLQRTETSSTADEAEVAAFAIFRWIASSSGRRGQDWFDRFWVYATQGLLVLRSVLVRREKYIEHLSKLRATSDEILEPALTAEMTAALPDQFWMVEASAQELFTASRRKFGEILLTSTQSLVPLELPLVHAVRLPGYVGLSNGKGELIWKDSTLTGHTGLFEG